MRNLFAACVAFLLLLAASRPSSAQAADKPDVEQLAYEWAMSKAAEQRREEILDIFYGLERTALTKPVAKWLDLATSREGALDLAIALNVPGLTDALKKTIDSFEEKTAIAMLVSGDKGAAEFLFSRWLAAAPDSDSFKTLTSAFQAHGVHPSVLEKLKGCAEKDDARGQAAWGIVSDLTDFDGEKAEFKAKWRDLKKLYEAHSKLFEAKYVDGLALYRHSGGSFGSCGRNARFSNGGGLVFRKLPKFVRDGLDLRVLVMAGSGKGLRVGVQTTKNSFAAREKDGVWDNTNRKIPTNVWIEITISIRRDRKGSEFTFIGTVNVDGKPVISPGAEGEISECTVAVGGGSLAVGLVEFIPVPVK